MKFRPTSFDDLAQIRTWVSTKEEMMLWSGTTQLRGQSLGRELVQHTTWAGFRLTGLPTMKLHVYAHNTPARRRSPRTQMSPEQRPRKTPARQAA